MLYFTICVQFSSDLILLLNIFYVKGYLDKTDFDLSVVDFVLNIIFKNTYLCFATNI